jgi:Ser/Thr protein kinase RdoA (MazF antagonist)
MRRARDFAALTRRGQVARLRSLGQTALAAYGLHEASLALLRHEHNTTFRVAARGGPYVLRISRPGVHTPQTIASELAWLGALRRDTELGVPEPVQARDGALVVTAGDASVPELRLCVLLRWLGGRFVDRRLGPAHLLGVGLLAARLQEHVRTWTPPPGFIRPRVDTLTDEGKVASLRQPVAGGIPAERDGERACELVETLMSSRDAARLAEALDFVRSTTRRLTSILVHGDLHYENVLFRGGSAGAIDFDDCGWGSPLYDLTVILSELEDRARYVELRDGLLEGYAQVRPLPDDYETQLDALLVLRRAQILLWVLESREHAAFRDTWQADARDMLGSLTRR